MRRWSSTAPPSMCRGCGHACASSCPNNRETAKMSLAGTERRRHLVTAVIGTVLMLFMGTVLLLGFRFATQMRANIVALQTASTLQTYPEELSHQLNALRDRLEVRAYSGQALADLQAT